MHLGPGDGTTIRYPSIANLMVDSADRSNKSITSANDFTISRPYSLLNGVFTRLATTEVVMEWNYPNIGSPGYTGKIQYNTPAGQEMIVVPEGFYTVEELINQLVIELNLYSATTNITWTVTARSNGGALLTQTGTGVGAVSLADDPATNAPIIALLFGESPVASGGTADPLPTTNAAVDLRSYRYLDIISPSLTYAQNVKDASTAPIVRDVLCRWYFDYDEQNMLDGYGYPILMGYKPFCLRRIYNPPKQIKWDNNLPVPGNIQFSVYNPAGELALLGTSEFLMTIQVSEN